MCDSFGDLLAFVDLEQFGVEELVALDAGVQDGGVRLAPAWR